MKLNKVANWKDCRDIRPIRTHLIALGGKVRPGAGDHEVWTAPDGTHFTVYNKELSKGVACKLFKWLTASGILLLVLGLITW